MNTVIKGPWFVRDMRAVELRRLGWTGPSIDQILITDQDGHGIIESQGQNASLHALSSRTAPTSLTTATWPTPIS